MKYLISLVLILGFIVSCNLFAQDNAYDFIWDANSEPDMYSYRIWVWEGADTVGITIDDFAYHGEFSHDSLVTEYYPEPLRLVDTYISAENGEYLKFAGKAVDDSGFISINYSYSPFVKKDDSIPPGDMSGLGIER